MNAVCLYECVSSHTHACIYMHIGYMQKEKERGRQQKRIGCRKQGTSD